MRALAAMLFASALLAAAGEARACVLGIAPESRAYVGGDLPTQIAQKASVIQIVRVASRAELEGSGGAVPRQPPNGTFKFRLVPVETLKADLTLWDRDRPLEFEGYAGKQRYFWRKFPPMPWDEPKSDLSPPLDSPPELALYPTELGYTNSCQNGMSLQLGDLYVALRSESGALYSTSMNVDQSLRLHADVSFDGRRRKQIIPSLIPISSISDPIVLRLKKALRRS